MTTFILFILLLTTPQTPTIEDTWITTDDETGLEKSEVVFYQKDNKLFGKIETLLLPEDQGKRCENCKGALKNQSIAGMVIVNNLVKTEEGWEEGTILDPKSGKEYDCYIEFIDENTLKVRGYLGFSLLGRTQIWKRKL
ncbi:MAG: DUF2147 domain-containing protein [Flavobacteriaceae bacterium]|jgi:uncharacterized protein (DUF2147 family)